MADREGICELHVSTVESAMCIFREFDAINYLRYGSLYLERIRVLEMENSDLHTRFMNGQFVVKDRCGSVKVVGHDMKLEQSFQHGIVVQTLNSEIATEWQLLFHEILDIDNFRALTNDQLMGHMEIANHHELGGRKGKLFAQLLDFVHLEVIPSSFLSLSLGSTTLSPSIESMMRLNIG